MKKKLYSLLAGFALGGLTLLVLGQATSISTPPFTSGSFVLHFLTNSPAATNGVLITLSVTNNSW